MKLKQFIKREFQSLGMSRQETAFVITLSIMLCILVSFIIVRVNNKPEEIWLEVPSTEEITKLLEEQEKLEDPQTEEDKPADNSQVTTRAYNEADSRIKQAEDLESLDDLLAKQEAENASGEGENSSEEGEGTEPPKVEPHKVNDGMSFKELEKYKAQPKDKKANKRTLISYSLVGRDAVSELPNPVYTCDASGKVVINIIVDGQGHVIEASYNKSASSTANGCLIDNAIYYARKARFNKDSKIKQIGTITYLFQ